MMTVFDTPGDRIMTAVLFLFVAFAEPTRDEVLKAIEEERPMQVKQLTDRVAKLTKELQEAEQQLADAKAGKATALPTLKLQDVNVGDFGDIDMDRSPQWLIVDAVRGEREFVATHRYIRNEAGLKGFAGNVRFLFRGIPTDGLVKRNTTRLKGSYIVSDEVTQDGKTMLVIEPFDVSDFLKRTAPAK